MKKYNLVIKESVKLIDGEDFPTLTTGNGISGDYNMLSKKGHSVIGRPFSFMLNLEKNRSIEMTTFTQQEIDELPHGFIKLFDVIEVKEELYYIKLPYGQDKYLNQNLMNGLVLYANNEQCETFQTCFTMAYIEEVFPMFKQFAVKVEEEK